MQSIIEALRPALLNRFALDFVALSGPEGEVSRAAMQPAIVAQRLGFRFEEFQSEVEKVSPGFPAKVNAWIVARLGAGNEVFPGA